MDGIDVVDGVATNPLAHAAATALRIAGARTTADIASVETDLYRANEIESDDTSVLRIRTTAGAERRRRVRNHHAPIPFPLLPEVSAVLKADNSDAAIILDTGIMSGADIVAALALGADFTLIGCAYLYGLTAGGRAGVDRAIQILEKDMARTMALLGVSKVSELTPDHVRLLRK
ncbi:isopentenyl diphosphate isomerase/L-lactate dehydrogenase-like FMN-dependent dehydrogenase [Arthrobacter sp. UYEF21]